MSAQHQSVRWAADPAQCGPVQERVQKKVWRRNGYANELGTARLSEAKRANGKPPIDRQQLMDQWKTPDRKTTAYGANKNT